MNTSNSLNTIATDVQELYIEAPVTSLDASLFQMPVIYLLAGYGEADFKFSYSDLATSGTDAKVTFWPGDAANDTFGPFDIGMNFRDNYNENPLSFKYTEVANFTAAFLIENRHGSKKSQVTFEVIPGLDGFFINCEPKRSVKQQPVKVSAFVIQGKDVNFTWYLEGALIHNQMRICNLRF